MDGKNLPTKQQEDSQRENVETCEREEYDDATGGSERESSPTLTPLTNVDPTEMEVYPGTSSSSAPRFEEQQGEHAATARVRSEPINICDPDRDRPSDQRHSSPAFSVTFPHEKALRLKGLQSMFSYYIDDSDSDESESEDTSASLDVESWSQTEHDLFAEFVSVVTDYVKKILAEKPTPNTERALEELDRSSPIKDLVEDQVPDLENHMQDLAIGGRKPLCVVPTRSRRHYRSADGRPLMVGSRGPKKSREKTEGDDGSDSEEDEVEKALAAMKRSQERAQAFAREDSEIESMKQLREEIIAEIYPRTSFRNTGPRCEEVLPPYMPESSRSVSSHSWSPSRSPRSPLGSPTRSDRSPLGSPTKSPRSPLGSPTRSARSPLDSPTTPGPMTSWSPSRSAPSPVWSPTMPGPSTAWPTVISELSPSVSPLTSSWLPRRTASTSRMSLSPPRSPSHSPPPSPTHSPSAATSTAKRRLYQLRGRQTEEDPILKRYYEGISNQFYHLWWNQYIIKHNIRVSKELKLLRLEPSKVTEEEINRGKAAMTQAMILLKAAHLGHHRRRPSQRTRSQVVEQSKIIDQPERAATLSDEAMLTDVARPSVTMPQPREASESTTPTRRDLPVSERPPSPSKGAMPKRRESFDTRLAAGPSRSPLPGLVARSLDRPRCRSEIVYPDSMFRQSRPSASADERKHSDTTRHVETYGSPVVGSATVKSWDWSGLNDPVLTNVRSEAYQRTFIDLDTKEVVPAGRPASVDSPYPAASSHGQSAIPSQLAHIQRNFSVFLDMTPLDQLPDPRMMPLCYFCPEENLQEFTSVSSRWVEIVRSGMSTLGGRDTMPEVAITVTPYESALQELWKAIQLVPTEERLNTVKRVFEEHPFLRWAFGLRFTQLEEARRSADSPNEKKTTSL